MGSVKDLKILEKATETKPGRGQFFFSDRYSVFDWGEMPDNIPDKGAAITILGAYFFEKLGKMKIQTHYAGVLENGSVKKLSDLKQPSNTMEVKLLRVVKPRLNAGNYDYSMYKNEKSGFLIPLEIIYRNSLPEGSSVFRRLEKGQTTIKDLGLETKPYPNQKLEKPILDVSTKLEITDRYITWNKAQEISALTDVEITDLKNLTNTINNVITEEFAGIGLTNEDGKIEVGFDNDRRLMLVDILGTLDECRFMYEDIPVSKEIARIYYRKTPWYDAVEDAKNKDRQNWKKICRIQPDPLPSELKQTISQIYCACTNEITGREWFKEIPALKDILSKIKKFLQ